MKLAEHVNLTEHPELVNWPEMHYVFVERIGPFIENAGAAWQQAHPLVPALLENNKITGYMALYKMGPKIYRAGFSLSGPPVKLPEGLKYEKFHGGKYVRFELTGPYDNLPEASGRAWADHAYHDPNRLARILPGALFTVGSSHTHPQRRSSMSIATTSSQPAAMEMPSGKVNTESKGRLWTSRILSGVTVLFMLFDAVGKFMMPPQVVEACTRLGFPTSLAVSVGVLLLVSTIIYAIPRTAVLGAVLLTGYLGGAVAIQMRAGSSTFETVFPVLFGVVAWAGIYLRDCKLRAVFPVRR